MAPCGARVFHPRQPLSSTANTTGTIGVRKKYDTGQPHVAHARRLYHFSRRPSLQLAGRKHFYRTSL